MIDALSLEGMERREYTNVRVDCPHGHNRSWSSNDSALKPIACCVDATVYKARVVHFIGPEEVDIEDAARATEWYAGVRRL